MEPQGFRHPHQVGQGFCLHLAHRLAAMDLDRDLAEAKLGSRLLYDTGIGVRYYTPVGPVRFDVATPLSRRQGDALFQIYVSLGQAF